MAQFGPHHPHRLPSWLPAVQPEPEHVSPLVADDQLVVRGILEIDQANRGVFDPSVQRDNPSIQMLADSQR